MCHYLWLMLHLQVLISCHLSDLFGSPVPIFLRTGLPDFWGAPLNLIELFILGTSYAVVHGCIICMLTPNKIIFSLNIQDLKWRTSVWVLSGRIMKFETRFLNNITQHNKNTNGSMWCDMWWNDMMWWCNRCYLDGNTTHLNTYLCSCSIWSYLVNQSRAFDFKKRVCLT